MARCSGDKQFDGDTCRHQPAVLHALLASLVAGAIGPLVAWLTHLLKTAPTCACPLQPLLPGVKAGDVLTFEFTATLAGAGSVTITLSLTAEASPVEANLQGPRGDVLVRVGNCWLAGKCLLLMRC